MTLHFFRLQMRKEDNIADRRGIGEQHNKSVDTYTFTGCRGHTIFKCPDIVAIQFRVYFLIITSIGNLFFKSL